MATLQTLQIPVRGMTCAGCAGRVERGLLKVPSVEQAVINYLVPFFQAVIAEDWSRVELVQQEMSRLEKEADKLKRNVRIHLPKSLFLPVPRSDLLELLSVQDKVANRAKDIAGLMLGRQMTIPQPMQPMILAFVQRVVDASEQALTAMNELDEILETGFGNREVNRVTAMIDRMRKEIMWIPGLLLLLAVCALQWRRKRLIKPQLKTSDPQAAH